MILHGAIYVQAAPWADSNLQLRRIKYSYVAIVITLFIIQTNSLSMASYKGTFS